MTPSRDHTGSSLEVVLRDDVEAEDTVSDRDVLDEDGKPRVLADQCITCVFRPGNLMHLRPGRLRDMVTNALNAGTWITCHQTLPYHPDNPGWQAICRGFHDRYGHWSLALQLLQRIRGITEIELPTKPCQHPPAPPESPDDHSSSG